jgi:hypothetical protein
MKNTSTRQRTASVSLTALLALIFLLAFAASPQAQVLSDPRIAEFDPSPDHSTVLDSGQPAVLRYDLDMYVVGASSPFVTVDMGKPSPDTDGKIRYDFTAAVAGVALPGGNYEARVIAVGPEGEALSDPSNPFTFTSSSGCTFSLNTTTVRAVASGGSYSADVATGSTCGWTATTSLAWVSLWATNGTGDGTVPFQVQANTSTLGRTGTITIGGRALTVAQDGATPITTTPTISWPTPSAITQGTALSATQLNATANVAGTFVYNPAAGTVLPAGTSTLKATFTPSDTTRYTTATAQTTLVVNAPRTTPVITWPAPLPITQGTPLGATQLNATASVPGVFVYNPAAGTVLAANTYTLRTTFTPADTTRYTTATASTSLTVVASTTPPPPPDDGGLPIGAPYTLSIVRPSGGLVKGLNINCGTTAKACSVKMPGPMTMTLQARADRGFVFTEWTGHCSGSSSTYGLALEGPRSCGAKFARIK